MLDQVSENQEIDFEQVAENSIEDAVNEMNVNVKNIVRSGTIVEEENGAVVAEVSCILKNLKDLEDLGCNVHTAWDRLYQLNGWSHKMQCANAGKPVVIDGNPAPKKIATYKSQSKSAYTHKGLYTIKIYGTWQELRDSYKKPDDFVQMAVAIKDLKTALKAVKSEKAGWIADAVGEINKLTSKYKQYTK